MKKVFYNERSWAIDLIGYIKQVLSSLNCSIKDAGGEQTIRTDGGNLFPDVLLFGDKSLALILQGWELKMPDTRIDDLDFIHNAKIKALALGLDSFVLWNVSHAHLYVRQTNTETFTCYYKWDDLAHVLTREAVTKHRIEWEGLALKIINYLNDLFDRNCLEGRQFVEAYKSGGITSLILENTDDVKNELRETANKDSMFKSQIILWSERHKSEYGEEKIDPYSILAQVNISNWIGKFLFAHILQGRDKRAQIVSEINDNTTPYEALQIFKTLSDNCNFWTIFSDNIGLGIMPRRAWDQIQQLNKLLIDLRIGQIAQNQLSDILEATVEVAVRKLRGQYPTPTILARILIELCIDNIHEDRVLDPCCGSGTIPRAALEQKLEAGVEPNKAAASVFAGDQDHQAVQISTFALAKPSLMDIPLRLFQKDAFFLNQETEIDFRDPRTGELFTEKAGNFNVIASNLPFIGQRGRKQYNNATKLVNDSFVGTTNRLPKNSDIAAYLPFSFHPLLVEGGRLGIIITNAWLSTAWGDIFFNLLNKYYNLSSVITSGAGRWFKNSDIVANILIMEKKTKYSNITNPINFVVLTSPLEELSNPEIVSLTTAQIKTGQTLNDTMTINSVPYDYMERFRSYGLGGNAQFVNCDWILDVPLIPITKNFNIRRGERRGWDKMFYPTNGHQIEAEYIQNVLKSSKEISGYVTTAKSEAFSCSLTMNELSKYGHIGAINWIKRFESTVNDTGRPLPEVLKQSGKQWYEMATERLTDLVMPLNFDKRLLISRLYPPAFINQRLVSFNAYDGVDIDLCHALLNSAISIFIIEGMGFGRGQGVLDLSKDRVEKFMHMLDPNRLNDIQASNIKHAFQPLLQRDVLEIADELEKQDRQDFDDAVINSFNLNVTRSDVYENIIKLVAIRQTARV